MPRIVNVLTHGFCFDGLASATLFTALRRALGPGEALEFSYRSCGYGPKLKAIPEGWLGGDENALLDFKHSPSGRLDWYFDHHATAFDSETARAAAERRVRKSKGKRHMFFDPAYTSCAKLIADVAKQELELDLSRLCELVEWADKVDSARFDTPDEAFFARSPALVLADVVEHHGDSAYVARMVPHLATRSLAEVAGSPETQALAAPLAAAKETYLAAVRARGERHGQVVFVDLSVGAPLPAGKFASYVAFPDCAYSVGLLSGKDQLKVGVGYNPWSGLPRRHDIAKICRREGGGGHAVVGAVNFALSDLGRARETALRIVRELGEER